MVTTDYIETRVNLLKSQSGSGEAHVAYKLLGAIVILSPDASYTCL